MTHLDDYHSESSYKSINIFLYVNIPKDNGKISFFTATVQNAMEKKWAFIPDLLNLESDEHMAVNKECYFCSRRTHCNCFKEFNPTPYTEFSYSQIAEPLYVCSACRDNLEGAIHKHFRTIDCAEVLADTL